MGDLLNKLSDGRLRLSLLWRHFLVSSRKFKELIYFSISMFAAIAAGVQGWWWLLVVVWVIGLILIWVSPDQPDVYHGVKEVNFIWEHMLRNANDSIEILAGDLSWMNDSRSLDKVLAEKKQSGLNVKIICRDPDHRLELKKRIAFLLDRGIEVRVLPSEYRSTYSGFIIDQDSAPERCTAFRRSTKANPDSPVGEEKKAGRRYIHERDNEQMQMWLPLYRSYWNQSVPAVLLKQIPIEQNCMRNLLREVNQYRNLDDSKFTFDCEVAVEDLFAWCLVQNKMDDVIQVMDQMTLQGIGFFEPFLCWSNTGKTILLPPIVEEHQGTLVVMEGAHRIAYLHKHHPKKVVKVIKISGCGPLPGIPVKVKKLPIAKERLGDDRPQFIEKYTPDNWRSFRPFLEALEAKASELTF